LTEDTVTLRILLITFLNLLIANNVWAVSDLGRERQLITPEQYLQDTPDAETDTWFSNPQLDADIIDFNIENKLTPTANTDIKLYLLNGSFQTRYGIYLSGSYARIESDGEISDPGGLINTDIEGNAGIIQVGKLILPRFYLGTSFFWINSQGTIASPTTNINIDSDSWTIAPHFSTFYNWGSWVVSTTPTYVIQLSKNEFSGGISGDNSDLYTLALYNSIAYHGRDWKLKFTADYNYIVKNNSHSSTERAADRDWLNLGLRFDYDLSRQLNAHATFQRYVGNRTSNQDILNFGLSYRF
jgi:hypothetical protein